MNKTNESGPVAKNTERAFDRIILSELSEYAGIIIYPHDRHYYPRSEGGQEIPCEACHFKKCSTDTGVIGSCRTCHPPHDEVSDRKIRAL